MLFNQYIIINNNGEDRENKGGKGKRDKQRRQVENRDGEEEGERRGVNGGVKKEEEGYI